MADHPSDTGVQPSAPGRRPSRLGSPELVREGLRDVGYLPNERIASVVYLGEQLAKPVLVEGLRAPGRPSSPRASR